ncbi:MAG TPA: hypothetical protein VGB03_06870, partial [Acidimicrobiales bacterium]
MVEQTNTTVIQSFDIDTLQIRRTLRVPGSPIASNWNGSSGPNNAYNSGDIVHAVDPGAKRIYLAMGDGNTLVPSVSEGTHQDAQRMVTYFLAIDEATFDTDPAKATGAFGFPTGRESLAMYPLMGMTVNRHRVAPTTPGKLVLIFSSPYFVTTTPGVVRTVPGAYDHTLAQWDPADVTIGTPLPEWSVAPGAKSVTEVWQQVLLQCATTTLTSSEHAETAPQGGTKNYQWGILVGRDSIHLGCQSAPGSGAVVRVDLDPVTGRPRPDQVLFPLGRHLADVLVDEPAGRLMLRTFGGGAAYWIFDTATARYTGATVASPVDGAAIAAGIDPSTGRLYLLGADICAPRKGGGYVPLRGGLRVTETRLDPVPASDVVLPELAYHSYRSIQVDPVTRRVFIRRGALDLRHHVYPGCDPQKMEKRPGEAFYRVYEDRRPPATPPGELDDATLTTNTAEGKGRTQASFLGAGSGYGMRSLLVGGLDAATQDAPSSLASLCGRDTREVVAGSVGKVEVSDQSTAAEAASLDADARTREVMGDPFNRCHPQAPQREVDTGQAAGKRNANELNRCHNNADVREGSFDQAKPGVDENGDGCVDRDGDNRYAARCVGTRQAESPGFDDDEHAAPRDGFKATATCDADDEKAAASSRAAAASDSVEEARRQAGQAGEPVRVAHAASTVEVVRKEGRGITVKVDSVARGVEIPGVGTIGVIRNEATSTSTGRDGGART